MGLVSQIKQLRHAWNTFTNEDLNRSTGYSGVGTFGNVRPDRIRQRFYNDRSMVSTIYNQIGIDAAAIDMIHVRVDPEEDDRYISTIKSGLNRCLTLEANIDEASRAFKQNVVMTMFDKGVVALVPVDTDMDPNGTNAYDILTMRVGEVVEWKADSIRVLVYNDKTGQKQEVTCKKSDVAIVENPLYTVMNEPNSTLQRLVRKLSLLDSVDEQASSGKLDIIIQLPYVVKTEARKQQALVRRQDLEDQLNGSKYGIAYTDGTEKITQLNRPAENNMMKQVEYLTTQLYSQLGLTQEVFMGTADETVMLNYYNRTLEPVLTAISQAMERTFLSKTAYTQGHRIKFYRNPFKLVPITVIGDLADKLGRNEVVSPNEVRGWIGLKPSKDKKADQLRNSNMPAEKAVAVPTTNSEGKEDLQNGSNDK